MKLYKIWKIHTGVQKNSNPKYTFIEYNEKTKEMAYPLVEFISILHWGREDLVSMDLPRLQEFCKYLNEIADSDERYEIREVLRDV